MEDDKTSVYSIADGDKSPHHSESSIGGSSNSNSNTKGGKGDEWALKHQVDKTRARDEESGLPPRELGVTWNDLTVKVTGADAAIHENYFSQYNLPTLIKESRNKPPLRTILDNSFGCVKPGEMLLVLGRPGSGCTTLLSLLANQRAGYKSVTGDVHYGSMDTKEAEQYRGQIVINTEEELFFPDLTVGQTMDFATKLKAPFRLPKGVTSAEELRQQTHDFLLESMGITHTHGTKVGNEYVRGVSGGERKRVSIIECLATNSSVYCWDNSTRGLDASTALEYTKAIRAMTDVLGLASIVTLYQAGNGIYNLFDKVLVLDGGKQIFYGSLEEARPFAESMGFICRDGANVGDFLTGLTVPTERMIKPGYENRFPRNAETFRDEFQKTDIYTRMRSELDYPTTATALEKTKLFQESVALEKHKHLASSSTLTVSFPAQVLACITRQYQIIWNDKPTLVLKQASTIIQSLISGSLFYDAPDHSGGLFVKSGALFFSVLFHTLIAMAEVTDSFSGRNVLIKHKSFGFFHPAAFCIGQIVGDIPIILLQITLFAIILYFMVGLTMTASAFFTYWIILFAVTMAMTAFFRAIGAISATFDAAAKLSGFMVNALIMYTGYLIQEPQMKPWMGWIFYINPLAFGFDALMSNEFHGREIPCVGVNLVPTGPGYEDAAAHQSCAGVLGALQGETSVSGDNYLSALSYGSSHIWRNFGILWAFWAFFVAVTILATMRWRSASEAGPSLLIPREKLNAVKAVQADEESQDFSQDKKISSGSMTDDTAVEKEVDNHRTPKGLARNTSVFTWKNLCYTVDTPDGERQLLDNVQGYVKPGMLGALMGSSGAGKTTLLDVLAQRKTEGTIRGSILVDGRPLPVSFQRSAGYCEQLDVHEPFATVREALEFSALLRQSRDTPKEEKLAYVDTIIDLLELHDLADTLIGRVGAGLTVEQRKRVTIGVELVSKPSILIFLDEPTSGLDGQSAFNTVRFLRKLADVGQAVLVTIHQPSAQLFAQFDTLLLLAKGGKTVYFGDIGDNAQTVRDYFSRYGAPCPIDTNPAEHMIDVVSGQLSQGKDWSQVWVQSPEYANVERELDNIIADAAAKPSGVVDNYQGQEFAMPLWEQTKLVCHRSNVAVFRNTDYINNKIALHIGTGLFNGFSFWMIGSKIGDLQLRLFTVFQFIFVAPGVINQLQPLFIDRRDLYETREKKSKMYSWVAFVTGLIVSEIPYLCICAVLYFATWYYTVDFPKDSNRAGATLFVMIFYEFLYTGIGQSIAAYAPSALMASLMNPIFLGQLVSFAGVLVSFNQLPVFWSSWMYWLDPFKYLMSSMLVFTSWETKVECADYEFALFDPAKGSTCREYLSEYLQGMGSSANLVNPDATADCRVCQYRDGSDWLRSLSINEYFYGWRDAAIVVLFVFSSYGMVYLMMMLRTKTSKKAE